MCKTELEKKAEMFDEMVEALKEIYLDTNDIPCHCDEFYKSRKLTDPSCPRCNWVDDELFDKMNSILERAKKIQEADNG